MKSYLVAALTQLEETGADEIYVSRFETQREEAAAQLCPSLTPAHSWQYS